MVGDADRGSHVFEQAGGHLLVQHVVFDEQDAGAADGLAWLADWRRHGQRHVHGHRRAKAHAAGEPEQAALAGLARHTYPAAHQFGELLAHGQAETGAAVVARGRGVDLVEALEQLRDLQLAQADAGVLDFDADEALGLEALLGRGTHTHLAPRRELDGVADVVQQHLPHAQRVAAQGARQARLDLERQVQTLRLGVLGAHARDAVEDAGQIEIGLFEHELARLDLGEIENVVDDPEQVLARAVDLFKVVALLRVGVGLEGQERQTDDRVHRCADLVAHVRQEVALGPAGGLCQMRGALQFLRAREDARLERLVQAQQRIGCAPAFGHFAEDPDLPAQVAADVQRRDIAFDVPVVSQLQRIEIRARANLAQGWCVAEVAVCGTEQLQPHEGEDRLVRGRCEQLVGQAPHLDECPVHAADAAGQVGHQDAVTAGLQRGSEQRTRVGEAEVGLDTGAHHGGVDRLDDEVDGAEFEATCLVAGVVMRRDEDDGNVTRQRVGLELAANLEAIHARHHDVEQDQVGPVLAADLQGLGAAQGLEHAVIRRERLVEHLDVERLVVDHQQGVPGPVGRGGGDLHGLGGGWIRTAWTARLAAPSSRPAS